MGGILDREKNRDNAKQEIKQMIKPDIPIREQAEQNKDFTVYAPDKMVVVPDKDEPRSKRVNLLIRPSLHKAAQNKCEELGISLNECINQLIAVWVEK